MKHRKWEAALGPMNRMTRNLPAGRQPTELLARQDGKDSVQPAIPRISLRVVDLREVRAAVLSLHLTHNFMLPGNHAAAAAARRTNDA